MRALLAALLLTAATTACTTTDSLTDLGDVSTDGKADVQTIKVPLKLAAGETAEFALTADGPFQAKTVYTQSAAVKLQAGEAQASGVQASLVIEGPRTPTEYILQVTNTGTVEIKGTFEIGTAAPSCRDEVWIGWFDTLVGKLDAAGSFIDQDERININAIVTNRPCQSASDGAYTRWLEILDKRLLAYGSFIDQDEKVQLDILKAQRPAAESEGAYLAWLPKFSAVLKAAGSFVDQDERSHLDLRLAVQPKPASSENGYIAWTRELRPMLVAAGSFIDQDERGNMQTLIKGKACAPATGETLAAWNALAAGASGDAASLLASAKPDAGCQ